MRPSSGLFSYSSHSLDALASCLAAILRQPAGAPLEPEWVLVQSLGMGRWLSLDLARRLGICANIEFLLPNRFVERLAERVLAPQIAGKRVSREMLLWRIFESLPQYLDRPEFADVHRYLAGDNPDLRRIQLAEKIAALFDEYPIYRRDVIAQWDAGGGEGWQPVLWRAVQGDGMHAGELIAELEKALPKMPREALPERVIAFGISTLPPFHLHILDLLGRYRPVTLLVNRPVSGSWADQPTRRESSSLRNRAIAKNIEPADLYLNFGNRLAAALGKTGRDFASLLGEFTFAGEDEIGEPPEGKSLLRQVQRQIYDFADEPDALSRTLVAERDTSIQVHSCHSPMRELEVLHDYLLDRFEQMPGLKPADVVVMTPDLDAYAPFVEAVFGARRSSGADAPIIPYSVADRTPLDEIEAVRVFLLILDLAGSRFRFRDLMPILESRPVREKFHIGIDEVERIKDWLEETNVRWGIDAEHRARLGFPAEPGNTWRHGLDRLLLGYAMAGQDRRLFSEILPLDNVEGSETEALGKLLEAFHAIGSYVSQLEGSAPPPVWCERLNRMLDTLFGPGEFTQRGVRVVRSALQQIYEETAAADFAASIGIGVLRRVLEHRLSSAENVSGYLTGAVTFCSLRPLRAVPFRVVCLLGMNDTAFPRQDRRPGFDLLNVKRRAGDRSVREDDRYLFLETLMAAKDEFYLSFLGRSLKDNSEIPPSVVISELLDYLSAYFNGAGVSRPEMVTQHRLHGFHPDYFQGGNRYFSYSGQRRRGAEALVAGHAQNPPFLREPLPEPEEDEWKKPGIDRFLRFFRNPAEFFLRERLGVTLDVASEPEPETEPFETGGLDAYRLREEMVAERLSGELDFDRFNQIARALGILPLGSLGHATFRKIRQDVQCFLRHIEPHLGESPGPLLDVLVEAGGLVISGRLKNLTDTAQIAFRCSKLKAFDRLRAWLRHLFLCATAGEGYPRKTVVIGMDFFARFPEIGREEACAYLQELALLFRQGMCFPLMFLPDISLECAVDARGNKPQPAFYWEQQMTSALGNSYFRCCFAEAAGFDLALGSMAAQVFGPMLKHEVLVKHEEFSDAAV